MREFTRNPVARASAAGALAACLAACQAFAPTIPQRMHPDSGAMPLASELSELARALQPATEATALAERPALPPVLHIVEPPAPPPRPHIGSDEKLSFEMRGTPLEDALHVLADKARINLYLDRPLPQPINASFPDVTVDDALAILLERNGLLLMEGAGGVYWIKPDDESQIETAVFQLQSVHATDLEKNLAAVVGSETKLVFDGAQNVILARGSKRDLALITAILAQSDRLKRQVLIEARIVELSLGNTFELGLSHALQDGDLGPATLSLMQKLSNPASSFSLVFDNDSIPITTTLTALSRYAGLNLVSSPRLLAVHGTQAKIEVITEVPYVQTTTSTTVGGGTSGSSVSEQVSFKEAGVKLTVTPLIQENGVVQLKISQELSEVVDYFNQIPIIDKRKLDSDFLVADGQTVVLGGLLENRSSQIDKGVPFLMDLPLIGRLFRSDEDQSKRRELLLFLTPKVLSPGEAASLAGQYASSYQHKLESLGVEPMPAFR